MMRVLIVGGAGVFGRRLAEGLRSTTDVQVIIAGRSLERAQSAAAKIGADAIQLDRASASAESLRAIRADLVVDAAGPFQHSDLSFARAVLEAGAHYLDLADARDFVAAFPTLDALAKARGKAAITGVSSTPALTHAALDRLCAGWRRVDSVRAGIAPGNRAPRGASLVQAILSWVGAPVRVFEQGAWRARGGWSNCGAIDVPGLGHRRFALADTPDLDLIPARFSTRDAALFMAALEIWPLHRGLELTGALSGLLGRPERFAGMFRRVGDLLWLFGTDRGAMIVEALGRDGDDKPTCARWVMIAPNGLGPYAPTLPALALIRRFVAGAAPPSGAYPSAGLLSLEEVDADFHRLGFTTTLTREPLVAPFEAALKQSYACAPKAVRNAHRGGPVTVLTGAARITGAHSPLAKFLARLFGLPDDSVHAPVRVVMRLNGEGVETWERDFGGERTRSRLRYVRAGLVRESFGPLGFDLALETNASSLTMRVVGWRIGPIPMPAFLAPCSDAVESEDEGGRFRFDVPIALPIIGRLTHYSGYLVAESIEAEPPLALSADA